MNSGPRSPYESPRVAVLAAERVEVGPHVAMRPPDLLEECRPGVPVRDRVAASRTAAIAGSFISIGLHETMRTHGRPLDAIAGNPTTLSSTMTSGASSSKISRSRGSTYFEPSMSACHVGAMNSPSCSSVLLRKTGAVSRMKSIQNWPGHLGDLGRRPETHEALLEALRLERAGERLLHDEDDPMAARAEDVPDADAVVRRSEGALGEEHDRPGVGHARPPGGSMLTGEPSPDGSGVDHGATAGRSAQRLCRTERSRSYSAWSMSPLANLVRIASMAGSRGIAVAPDDGRRDRSQSLATNRITATGRAISNAASATMASDLGDPDVRHGGPPSRRRCMGAYAVGGPAQSPPADQRSRADGRSRRVTGRP